MSKSTRYFVTRSIDNAILGKDGRWVRLFADVGDIKFYASCARATKYGFAKIPASMYKTEPGNMESIGTAHAVYRDESVNICGQIHDANGNSVRRRH
jgi:hypothetical protein